MNDASFLRKKIRSFWSDSGPLLQHGIGFCAMQGPALASLCLSGFADDGGVQVVDVETLPDFQRQGFGFQVGQAFVSECLNRGYEPHWAAMEGNEASRSLTSSLGLGPVAESTVYYFQLAEN